MIDAELEKKEQRARKLLGQAELVLEIIQHLARLPILGVSRDVLLERKTTLEFLRNKAATINAEAQGIAAAAGLS